MASLPLGVNEPRPRYRLAGSEAAVADKITGAPAVSCQMPWGSSPLWFPLRVPEDPEWVYRMKKNREVTRDCVRQLREREKATAAIGTGAGLDLERSVRHA